MQTKDISLVAAVIFFFMCSLALSFWTTGAESAGTQGGPVDLVTAIEQVAKRNIPAVVHIEVTERQEVANPIAPFENDPFFRYFFNTLKNMPKKFHREIMGLGTGMIMDT